MKINVQDIPLEGLQIDKSLDLATDGLGQVDLNLSLNWVEKDIFVSGSASADMTLNCSRCIKEFKDKLSVEINLVFVPSAETESEEQVDEDSIDELTTSYYLDDEINLTQAIREQLLINLPMKPLCGDECKGICLKCGADLNEGQCSCKIENIDPRLQVLKEYLNKKKE